MKCIDFSALRILILEDERYLRAILKQLLRGIGSREIWEGNDGTEGLRLLDDGLVPDLVLCDVQMAPMDGLTFIRQVRGAADPARARIPMIMLTAAADEGIVRTAAGLGIDGYLVKPVSQRLLADRISAALASRAGQR